jgi:hypothetical protein
VRGEGVLALHLDELVDGLALFLLYSPEHRARFGLERLLRIRQVLEPVRLDLRIVSRSSLAKVAW